MLIFVSMIHARDLRRVSTEVTDELERLQTV